MNWMFVQEETLPEAHIEALRELLAYGIVVDAPDWNERRKEISLIQVVAEPLLDPMVSLMIPCGAKELKAYIKEVCEGTMDKYVPDKLPYTYHDRMMVPYTQHTQLDYVVDELVRNPMSTRACIVVRRAEDVTMKDQPCLSFIQYMIRKDRLETIATFRSNDAVKASAMNDIALVKLSEQLVGRLREKKIYVRVGSYTKIVNSYHAYERDWNMLRAYVRRATEEEVYSEYFDIFMRDY